MTVALLLPWTGPARRRLAPACAVAIAAAALACSRPAPPAHAPGDSPRSSGPPAAAAATPALPGPGPKVGAQGAEGPAPPPSPAAAPAASPGASPAASPARAPLTAAVALASDGERPLALDAPTSVDPRSSFRLEVAAHLTDGRLVLLDEQDAMVASTGTAELGATWTRYTLTPDAPLSPGASYTLRLDGSASRDAHDPAGHAFAPARLQVRVTGDRQPAAARRRSRR